jgi:hypothetical protein
MRVPITREILFFRTLPGQNILVLRVINQDLREKAWLSYSMYN